ncbi:MAG: hypothetical protein RLZZ626_1009 [Actinomycetota bacterium]|jgi:ribose transport system permease protein
MTDSKQDQLKPAGIGAGIAKLFSNQSILLVAVILVLGVFFSIQSGGDFAKVMVFNNILTDWGSIILLAVGQTLVVISGGIDLSVGATVCLSSVVSAFVMMNVFKWDGTVTGDAATVPLLVGTLVSVLTGAAVGAVNAVLINVAKIVPFIATLATLSAAGGLAIIISGGQPLQGPNNFALISAFGDPRLNPFSFMIIAVIVVVIIAGLFIHKAKLGLYTYAIGSNTFAARGAGINVERHLTKVYVLSGVFAGLGGMYSYIRLGAGSPTSGAGMELYAIAATVIGGASLMGGVGRILGTVLGTLVLYTVQSGLLMINVSPDWKQIVVAILIAGAVAVQGFKFTSKRSK